MGLVCGLMSCNTGTSITNRHLMNKVRAASSALKEEKQRQAFGNPRSWSYRLLTVQLSLRADRQLCSSCSLGGWEGGKWLKKEGDLAFPAPRYQWMPMEKALCSMCILTATQSRSIPTAKHRLAAPGVAVITL